LTGIPFSGKLAPHDSDQGLFHLEQFPTRSAKGGGEAKDLIQGIPGVAQTIAAKHWLLMGEAREIRQHSGKVVGS